MDVQFGQRSSTISKMSTKGFQGESDIRMALLRVGQSEICYMSHSRHGKDRTKSWHTGTSLRLGPTSALMVDDGW